MAQGSVVKCMAIYPEPFWRTDGFSGQVTSADGPVSVVYDNSPPDGSPGESTRTKSISTLSGSVFGMPARTKKADWLSAMRRMAGN